ncbi:AAA family ATPase [Aquibacillus halophilus]|uniref:AAA family ATPase n=1 Tax=Aquibacillus halophilus TaxID=930132 RepID=A0A6A8DMX9_9BACI|nr:AAA family ATPase [Aquibacillus halophilus]MRH42602.1 AAA family ATPase [Aquibacillus halophilus]
MENHDVKILKKKISQWSSTNDKPPLYEVEVLRIIDWIKGQQIQSFSKANLSNLYCMLAFYRLKRNFNDDQITELLLEEAERMDEKQPVLLEIKNLKFYFNFYSELNTSDFKDWSIRETDFDPAKLKKAKELLEQVNNLINQIDFLKNTKIDDKSELNNLTSEIDNELRGLNESLETSINSIENKRSEVPVQKLNQHVKKINHLKLNLYEQFPDIFKKSFRQDPLIELDEMIGLKDIKKYIHQYYHYLKYQKERKSLGFHMIDEPGLHMIITGNPGTGKTTIARLLAAIYYELGLLETGDVTEVNRSHLVGSYVGQSEENTVNFVRDSIGGILFIDEAYSLKREGQSGNDYGQAVIDTLVSSMTSKEYANRFAVILAGYPEEMRQFLWSNPGLRSRFPEQNHISLPDFETKELIQIAENTALSNDYFFTKEALYKFESLIEKSRVDETFGNARTVRDLVLKSIFKKGASKTVSSNENWLEHMRIDKNDLDFMDNDSTDTQPVERLEQLIGLTNVKQEVKKLSSFVRVQQQRKQKGLPVVPVQLHAVFSGNPGTGKTTIAKIYSQILKECGLLKRGHLVIASRSDLVAGYVGQTAIKTKQKVRESLGGVLFIDEAYSLYRGEKDFGKEAIDTLVDEMTKHNENLVVVLAGYRNEMQRFILSNPGLESRFKKYLKFPDYNDKELLDITKLHTENYQYELEDNAIEFLSRMYKESNIDGNARFVANLIDEAIQYQALRVEDAESLDSYQTLEKIDFQNAWETVKGSSK